jgi:formate-nitrite transporter family protein
MERHRLIDPVGEQDHSLGPAGAPVTVVEYGDYECPDCLNAVPVIRAVRGRLGDRLRFVFRHFPQYSVHPHASIAAEAAEAAADQGKFWQMHEALFERQAVLGEVDFVHLAGRLGLEIYRFQAVMGSDAHRRRIRQDSENGARSGVTRTPTLFINEWKYDGNVEVDAIVAACEAAA